MTLLITPQAEIMSSKADPQQHEAWRHRLHRYLDRLFAVDQTAAAEFHGVQVALYADFAPEQLLLFLQASQGYSLDKALEICAARGFVREQVYILERMGNSRAALELLIGRLRDLPKAIELVARQGDAALWDVLIDLTLGNNELTGINFKRHGSNAVNTLVTTLACIISSTRCAGCFMHMFRLVLVPPPHLTHAAVPPIPRR